MAEGPVDLQQIERVLRLENPGATHWDGCVSEHPLCALRVTLALLRATREALRNAEKELRFAGSDVCADECAAVLGRATDTPREGPHE